MTGCSGQPGVLYINGMKAYPLESTDRERHRLERQARLLRPFTERLSRAAGAAEGASVLDLGTGAGDVALLAADIVGPSGRVLSLDRDSGNLDRARARISPRARLRPMQR